MCVLSLPPDTELFGPDWRKEWLKRLEAVGPVTHNWMRHQRRDGYWQHGSVCEDYSQIKYPVYAVGGFVDAYTNSIPRLLNNLKVPRTRWRLFWSNRRIPCLSISGKGDGFQIRPRRSPPSLMCPPFVILCSSFTVPILYD